MELAGARSEEGGAVAAGEDGRHPLAFTADGRETDGEDAPK